MSHIRTILENALNTTIPLFHGSRTRFKIGTLLTPQSEGYVQGSGMDEMERDVHVKTERVMEKYRPANAVPRHKAVFMVSSPEDIDSAGGYIDFVYRVKPTGTVSKCNLDWYSELYNYLHDEADEKEVARLASNYWNAVPSSGALYEYLAVSAQITELAEVN